MILLYTVNSVDTLQHLPRLVHADLIRIKVHEHDGKRRQILDVRYRGERLDLRSDLILVCALRDGDDELHGKRGRGPAGPFECHLTASRVVDFYNMIRLSQCHRCHVPGGGIARQEVHYQVAAAAPPLLFIHRRDLHAVSARTLRTPEDGSDYLRCEVHDRDGGGLPRVPCVPGPERGEVHLGSVNLGEGVLDRGVMAPVDGLKGRAHGRGVRRDRGDEQKRDSYLPCPVGKPIHCSLTPCCESLPPFVKKWTNAEAASTPLQNVNVDLLFWRELSRAIYR